MKIPLLILLYSLTQSQLPAPSGWKTMDGKPVPSSESLKSIQGFGGWLVVTPDMDWKDKWETPPETIPRFSEADKVKYGENLAILTFFTNPKIDSRGQIHIVCDIKVTRPNNTVSIDMKNIDCARGSLLGNPLNVRLTTAVIEYSGDDGDPPGIWVVEITLMDRNRGVTMPLKTQFELVKD